MAFTNNVFVFTCKLFNTVTALPTRLVIVAEVPVILVEIRFGILAFTAVKTPAKLFVAVINPVVMRLAVNKLKLPFSTLMLVKVAAPLTLTVPRTSKVAIGFVVPIPTEPESILTKVVLSAISKLPTLSEF